MYIYAYMYKGVYIENSDTCVEYIAIENWG